MEVLRPGSAVKVSDSQRERIFRIRRWVLTTLCALLVLCIIVALGVSARRFSHPGPSPSASVSARPVRVQPKPGGKPTASPAAPLGEPNRASVLSVAEATAAASGKPPRRLTYCVAGKGQVGDTAAFERTIFLSLNDPRGWPRAGTTFVQGSQGSCDMTLILSEAQYMRTFALGCSSLYSCRVGNQVIINKDRWNGGTDYWLGSGGDMARYRIMVINHEVGHRLGHIDNEQACAGPGQPAPLMLEQSMGLHGCVPNEWPLDSELWVK
ncbi:hypothetical protein AB656_04495 [Bifidobacterium actinocoloniiforme DSM 22766]|nr:hypothetical protein AB656_04495 [Bifidobacterium actinocoloniiforme DSM 22766]